MSTHDTFDGFAKKASPRSNTPFGSDPFESDPFASDPFAADVFETGSTTAVAKVTSKQSSREQLVASIPDSDFAQAHPNGQTTVGTDLLRELVQVNLRQETLLSQLLVKFDEVVAVNKKLAERIEVMESKMTTTAPPAATTPSPPPPVKQSRGNLVLPPGRREEQRSVQQPTFPLASKLAQEQEAARLEAQRKLQDQREIDRRRLEEEERKRAELLARKREEEDRRRREAEELRRQERQRREEEQRKIREDLEKKTQGLMSALMGSGGDSLFHDDEPKPASRSLFDD